MRRLGEGQTLDVLVPVEMRKVVDTVLEPVLRRALKEQGERAAGGSREGAGGGEGGIGGEGGGGGGGGG
jgi:hypothetical protein